LEIAPLLRKNGQPYKLQPSKHQECNTEYWLAQNASKFRSLLIERDGEACVDCGETPHSWQPQKPPCLAYSWDVFDQPAGKYCQIEWRLMLEVDHDIPLWKVAHLPDAQRRQYFKIGNLQLRCPACHKYKSAKEAAERAHHKRLIEPKKRRGRKLQGRGFDKTLRRTISGRVEVRT
jgi:hypothetical protein